jgi:hypothetical protein
MSDVLNRIATMKNAGYSWAGSAGNRLWTGGNSATALTSLSGLGYSVNGSVASKVIGINTFTVTFSGNTALVTKV